MPRNFAKLQIANQDRLTRRDITRETTPAARGVEDSLTITITTVSKSRKQ